MKINQQKWKRVLGVIVIIDAILIVSAALILFT
jgi:hypothetical protein